MSPAQGAAIEVPVADLPATLAALRRAVDLSVPAVVAGPGLSPGDRSDVLERAGRLSGSLLVLHTSGTSGRPRIVVRDRESWTASFPAFSRLAGIGPGTRVLVPGPLFSTLFLFGAVHADAVGAAPFAAPVATDAPWDVAHLVPAMLTDLLDGPLELTGRTAVVAGDALPPALAARALERGLNVVGYYGAAELSLVAMGEWRPGAGLPVFPGVRVRQGGDGRDGEGGEIWVASPYVARGYLGPEGECVTEPPLHRDGAWVTVGDRGRLAGDPDDAVGGTSAPGGDGTEAGRGRLYVEGRGDRSVTTGANTVLCEEVEAALRELPGVADAVVVGTPHARLGAVVTAVLELRPGSDPPLADLRAGVAARLAPPQRPRRWYALPALPRTPAGKVARSAVAAAAEAGTLRARPLR